MTFAPAPLAAARSFLLANVPGLKPVAVGIVGDTAHAATGTSYHLGKDQLASDSYSIVESPRDRKGLSNAAAGLDIGEFSFRAGGKAHTLRTFSAWLVLECRSGAADTQDIREVIYSLDGTSVRRWDRLGRRTTGDSSHRWHTHISYFRDSEQRDKTGLFRRYLTEIGLLEAEVTEAQLIAAVTKALQSTAGRDAIIAALQGWTEEDPLSEAEPKARGRIGGWLRMLEARARERQSELLAAIKGPEQP